MITWKLFQLVFKKLSDVVSKKVDERTRYNKLNTKVDDSKNEIPDALTLVRINHITQVNKVRRKTQEILIKKCMILVNYQHVMLLIQKLEKFRTKWQILVVL